VSYSHLGAFLLGKLAARKIPLKAVRIVAAGLFAVLAVLTLVAS
jgi:putative Ca2+/H+ antiporter (TMEM165/GDT1 family)